MRALRLILLLLGSLLIFVGTRAYAAFTDIELNVPGNSAFITLEAQGIISGYPDGTLRPHAPLTRAEGLAALLRSREKYMSQVEWFRSHLPKTALFPDVDQTAWYAPFIEVAFLEELTKGYPDGTFRPEQLLTRSEANILLSRVFPDRTVALSPSPGPITRGTLFIALHEALMDDGGKLQPEPEPPSPPTLSVHSPLLKYASEKPFAITIPKLDIADMTVSHPENTQDQKGILAPLERGVGHLFSHPGDGGKIMIYGHSSNWPWIVSEFSRTFRRINQLREGDRVYVTHEGKLHVYEVTGQRSLPANDVSAFHDSGEEELILYTCWPPDSIKERLHVFAKPVQTVALR